MTKIHETCTRIEWDRDIQQGYTVDVFEQNVTLTRLMQKVETVQL